jgi:hypothetical protein
VKALFVPADLSPAGRIAKAAWTFSDMATLAFEKLSLDELRAAKNVPNRAENADFVDDPLSFMMSGVPLFRLLPLLLLKQKNSRPTIARKEMTPKTAPTTAPGWTFVPLPPDEWPSPEEWSEPSLWPSPSACGVGVNTTGDVIDTTEPSVAVLRSIVVDVTGVIVVNASLLSPLFLPVGPPIGTGRASTGAVSGCAIG